MSRGAIQHLMPRVSISVHTRDAPLPASADEWLMKRSYRMARDRVLRQPRAGTIPDEPAQHRADITIPAGLLQQRNRAAFSAAARRV